MKKFTLAIASAAAVIGIPLLILNAIFSDRFLPGTEIDGVDVSLLTVEEADEKYKQEAFNVPVTVSVGDKTFEITQELIDYSNFTSTKAFMNNDRFNNLIDKLVNGSHFQKEDKDAILEATAKKIIESWDVFDEGSWTKSENAYLDYIDGWVIVPEVKGNEINLDTAKAGIKDVLSRKTDNYDLSTLDKFYIEPEITKNTEKLKTLRKDIDDATNKNIFYEILDKTFELDQKYLSQYATYDNTAMTFSIDCDKASKDFAAMLSENAEILRKARTFKTTLGDYVEVPSVVLGTWTLNEEETASKLKALLEDRFVKAANGELVWEKEPSGVKEIDYLNYVEIDLTNQTLYMYKNGEFVISSPIVSGNLAAGDSTPPGIFYLTYKTRNAVLRGPTWNSPVSFWMPFNGGIGMHDAPWKSVFGGTEYKTRGSHGCINLPYEAAKTIYENIDSSFLIICYWR